MSPGRDAVEYLRSLGVEVVWKEYEGREGSYSEDVWSGIVNVLWKNRNKESVDCNIACQ
jgi:crotonobetainyl-CoA:carnitine CoA-transferase CaiB-like acyl-CoA transferase